MQGGCHCGAIRYQISGRPFDADFCHCRDCQKITGTPVAAWMDFKIQQVQWIKGAPTEYASSPSIRRGFCPACGSTLSYRSVAHPDYLTLGITTLDAPDAVQPSYHLFTDSQVGWLKLADTCQRHPGAR